MREILRMCLFALACCVIMILIQTIAMKGGIVNYVEGISIRLTAFRSFIHCLADLGKGVFGRG